MAEANKKPNIFVRFGRGIAKWFREMKSELKKVVWPSASQLRNNTLIVLTAVVIVGIIVYCFDWLSAEGITLLGGIFN